MVAQRIMLLKSSGITAAWTAAETVLASGDQIIDLTPEISGAI